MTDTKTAPAPAAATAEPTANKLPTLGLLEEDDEFEEFTAEGD